MTDNLSPVTVDDVVINSELINRPYRAPDYEAENQALTALAEALANAPDTILQRLTESALKLCSADTAGVSLLEENDGAEVFRWEALAGVFRDRRNSTMPRNASPCGTTIDRNTTQLMYMAERAFPALTSVPPVVEALLVPFRVEQKSVGTLWVVAHDERRKFDLEDERIIKTLADFASASWQVWRAQARAEAAAKDEQQRAQDLLIANQALKAHVEQRLRVEEQLQRFNELLQDRITQSKAESTTGQSLGETSVAGVVHDFNNLLNVIDGYATLIMSDPAVPSGVIVDAKVIQRTVEEGVALTRQLLADGRTSEAKLDLVDINELIRRRYKLLTPIFPRTFDIVSDFDMRLPMVQIDATLVDQAILNICVNARDAMPDGGKLLLQTRSISGDQLRQRFPAAEAGKYVDIGVKDTGIGMTDEVKKHIFDPYFTTKKSGQGTGLGLSNVRDIVARHAGFIEMTSAPACGSTVHVYLPMPRGETGAADMRAVSVKDDLEDQSLRRPTVLYADDEERLVVLMCRLLKEQGFRVLTAHDGAEALQVHSRYQDEISVAILDSGLPKVNGWEALQRMRQIRPELKGILTSDYLSAETESRVAKGDLYGVLQKPYAIEHVLSLLKPAIQTS